MLAQVALASLLGLVSPAQSGTVVRSYNLQAPAQLELDGHYYALPAGTIDVRSDGSYSINASLAMANCVRPGGAQQQATANALRWNAGLRVVYLDPTTAGNTGPVRLSYQNGAWIVMVDSATGDLTCDGEVMPTGVLFRSGFE